jgi:hypothetical protein
LTASGPGQRSPAWAWPAAVLLIAAVSLAPFAVVDAPAVLDYPNHLARFYILAHPDDPILSKMYAPNWAILPNVGLDVIGQGLLRFLSPQLGGRVVLALSLLAPFAGATLYARAAFGRWTWWSLGAAVLTFNGMFFLGVMNFLLGIGVAMAGAGAWRVLRRQGRYALAALAGAAIGLAAFLCHILGFGFFAILIVAEEADGLLGLRREGQLQRRHALMSAGTLAVALGPTALLYVLTHRSTERGDLLVWRWRAKLVEWLAPFMTYDMGVTVITALVLVGVTILLWRRAQRASGVDLALASLAVLYLAAPFAVAGGTFVDTRIPLMAALLVFAGIAPAASPRVSASIAVAFALLLVGRAALVAQNWQGHAKDLANLRSELAYVEPGAKVLPARAAFPDDFPQGAGRVLPNLARLDDHLGALAVIERRAFWPLLFADPGQQPLVVRPPYDRLSEPLGAAAPWQDLIDDPPTPPQLAAFPYLADWRTRFDYVLLLGPKAAGPTPIGLRLIRADEATSLYRIDHSPAP